MATILEVGAMTKRFGGLTALKDVDLRIEEGEIQGLIGPNGAGKTTFFNLITGIFPPTSGVVLFRGRDLLHAGAGILSRRRKPHEITQRGIGRTFQNIRLFQNMTALENVIVGTDAHHKQGVLQAIFRTPAQRREERSGHDRAEELLDFEGIHRYANELAGNLSSGDQRRAVIARALTAPPVLLLLDEPAAGMNPHETHEITELIGKLRGEGGYTILVIEHDMHVVEGISDRVVALDHGQVIARGSFDAVATHPAVVEAYLGRGAADGDG